jgi:hypothetical protein
MQVPREGCPHFTITVMECLILQNRLVKVHADVYISYMKRTYLFAETNALTYIHMHMYTVGSQGRIGTWLQKSTTEIQTTISRLFSVFFVIRKIMMRDDNEDITVAKIAKKD